MSSATITSASMASVFTPPADCSSSWTYEASTYNGHSGGYLIQNAYTNDAKSCFPDGFAGTGRAGTTQTYSPGACPEGYVTQDGTIFGSVTIATCCYESFTVGEVEDSRTFTGCLSSFSGRTSVAARSGGFGRKDATSSTTLFGTYTMWAQPIVVAFEKSDASLFEPTSTEAPTTTSAEARTTISSETSESSPTETSDQDSTSLPSGAIAGIAVGVVAVVALVLGFAFYIWRRKRGKSAAYAAANAAPNDASELDPAAASWTKQGVYMQSQNWQSSPAELDVGPGVIHELDSQYPSERGYHAPQDSTKLGR